jgi:hypothetical protein
VYARERLPAMVARLECTSESIVLDEVELWRSRLEELLVRAGEHVFRREARMRLRDYVKGLLAQVGRKNTWQIAEYVGHATPDGCSIYSPARCGIPRRCATRCAIT